MKRFIGREDELNALENAWHKTEKNRQEKQIIPISIEELFG